jgi:hypothetical protein
LRLLLRSVLLALLGTASVADAAPILSDFSADTDGWMQSGASVFQHNASGGNPGGFLFIDNSEGAITYIFAPSKFLGNLAAYDGGAIGFDGNMLGIGGTGYTSSEDYGHLLVAGPGGSAVADLVPGVAPDNTPPQDAWASFSVDFTAAEFGVSQAQWDAILADVTQIRLSVEALFGAEVQGIDNVQLVPEPAPGLLAALYLLLVWRHSSRSMWMSSGSSAKSSASGWSVGANPRLR